jgi:hypothetical protein
MRIVLIKCIREVSLSSREIADKDLWVAISAKGQELVRFFR